METTNLGKSIKEIFDGQYKYIVPLYQRNFAWRQEQIEQLLQDVYEAYNENKTGNYFIGSLIVLKRPNGDFEVIDGQQRLTTLSLITKIMGINNEPRLFYDSRPEVEEFFQTFYKSEDAKCDIDYPQTYYLKNAIDYIKKTKLDAKNNETVIKDAGDEFKRYFANNVILVCVEIPQDTDVASYFEIMNNRGEQLQKHEILKSLMMSKLNNANQRTEFAKIWDACSHMNVPIQKSFKAGKSDEAGTRNYYFGDNYDEFKFDNLKKSFPTTNENDSQINDIETGNGDTIDEIIDGKKTGSGNDCNTSGKNSTDDDNYESEDLYKSIIDFPNFLMHVFKSMFPDIPLNEKFLLSTYKEVEKNPVEKFSEKFILKLFFFRTVFDRYIVKTTESTEKSANANIDEDDEKWTLIKPKKYTTNTTSWKYIGTFYEEDHDVQQERIIKALSMLQVTYRTRIYKDWLYEILKWFDEIYEKNKKIDVSYEAYIEKLDKIILNNYEDLKDDEKSKLNYEQLDDNDSLTKENLYSLGTNTPHFLFNFIDYLYWVEIIYKRNPRKVFKDITRDITIESNSKIVDNFSFKYYNSVEHHYPQNPENEDDKMKDVKILNNLGNLYLISKGINSKMSNQMPIAKMSYKSENPNRRIIYYLTKEVGYWNEKTILGHYKDLVELLKNREVILKLQ